MEIPEIYETELPQEITPEEKEFGFERICLNPGTILPAFAVVLKINEANRLKKLTRRIPSPKTIYSHERLESMFDGKHKDFAAVSKFDDLKLAVQWAKLHGELNG